MFNASIFQNPENPGIRPATRPGFEVKLSYPRQVWKAEMIQNQWNERSLRQHMNKEEK